MPIIPSGVYWQNGVDVQKQGAEELIRKGDERILKLIDGAFAAAERSGRGLVCPKGCVRCCIGPFPISALDEWRLRRGLRELEQSDPERAAAVRARAGEAVEVMRPHFPGDAQSGRLDPDDEAEERFLERFAAVPCPALDRETGRCNLYTARPLSCRTYGHRVRIEGEELPPCEFALGPSPATSGAPPVEIEVADLEQELCRIIDPAHPEAPTIVAFALADTKE